MAQKVFSEMLHWVVIMLELDVIDFSIQLELGEQKVIQGVPKMYFWNDLLIMIESDVMIYQKCILNYGRIKSSDSESTFFGTPCILLFVIANCFLLLATSLQAPSTLT